MNVIILYQEHILRFNNLRINGQKLLEMGYTNKKIKIVLEDVRRQIVTKKIENTEESITSYVTTKYKTK